MNVSVEHTRACQCKLSFAQHVYSLGPTSNWVHFGARSLVPWTSLVADLHASNHCRWYLISTHPPCRYFDAIPTRTLTASQNLEFVKFSGTALKEVRESSEYSWT
jgi:hypothetical protein